MGIVVIGAVFVDIKGFPLDAYIPTGSQNECGRSRWGNCGRRYSKH